MRRTHHTPRKEKTRPVALRHNQDGSAAVEFALVGIVLVTIVLAVIDFGAIYQAQSALQSGCRDAARQLSVGRLTAANTPAFVKSQVPGWIVNDTTIVVTQTAPTDPKTNSFTVTATVPMTAASFTGFFNTMFGTRTIRGLATMRQEPA